MPWNAFLKNLRRIIFKNFHDFLCRTHFVKYVGRNFMNFTENRKTLSEWGDFSRVSFSPQVYNGEMTPYWSHPSRPEGSLYFLQNSWKFVWNFRNFLWKISKKIRKTNPKKFRSSGKWQIFNSRKKLIKILKKISPYYSKYSCFFLENYNWQSTQVPPPDAQFTRLPFSEKNLNFRWWLFSYSCYFFIFVES